MTVRVVVDRSETIIDAAPIVRKFVGQKLSALSAWMTKFGGFEIELVERVLGESA